VVMHPAARVKIKNRLYSQAVGREISSTAAGHEHKRMLTVQSSFPACLLACGLVSWALFFREQLRCRCGHTRGEHRAGPIRQAMRRLLGRPEACTACPCRGFQLVKG
jgi:hypothetical protein